MVLKSLAILLTCEGLVMIPALIVALIYNGADAQAFATTIGVLLSLGVLGLFITPKQRNIYAREGFVIVAIGWILTSFFGALPFTLSGAMPSMVDSFFEAASGFTTTGATILENVEVLPKGISFWRSFTHWVGGMGVLVMTLAIFPATGASGLQIMKAESPGPSPGKLVPKIKQTAKILYGIYIIITIALAIALKVAGMTWYDSIIHSFGTVGTGGFSNKALSIGAYNSIHIEMVITFFMLVCGINFALYYQLLRGNVKEIFRDEEFKFYIGVVLVSIMLITININGTIFQDFRESLRYSSFQVASVMTTTGYATTDFNLWPLFSKMILLALMFFGGCAGSTAGGMKNIRLLLLFKIIRRELSRIVHPKGIYTVKFDDKAVDEEVLSGVTVFFSVYMAVILIAILIISLEGFDGMTTISSVVTTVTNVGPGFEIVGPMGGFADFSNLGKIVLSICMIIGRLEIYPVLLLFAPGFWKK